MIFTHEVPLAEVVPYLDRIGIWFMRRRENRSTKRKTSWSREENQQQTQPTYDAESGNRAAAPLVEGARCHHCTSPVIMVHLPLKYTTKEPNSIGQIDLFMSVTEVTTEH